MDVPGDATIGGTLTAMGQLVAAGIYDHGHIQGQSQTIVPEFSASNMQTATITGNCVLSATNNRQPGATITLRISAYENNMNITWNDEWTFLGYKVMVIPTNTYGILSLQCFGSNESDIIASFALSNYS